jgi:glycosyltransferase involved in cell wall biosynthesis
MQGMTALATQEAPVDPRQLPMDVEIVVPVYNEAPQLAARITALRSFLDESFPFRALVTIVDNASTDDTMEVARTLTETIPGIAVLHLPRKGRGYALRSAWSTSSAPVVAYMDVDLYDGATGPVAAGGAAPLWPPRRRHRLTLGARSARRAWAEARTDLARVQPVAQGHVARALQ